MSTTIEELLLLLVGQPSSFFVVVESESEPSSCSLPLVPWSWTLRWKNDTQSLSHPGDMVILNSLASLAAKYRRVRIFALSLKLQARNQIVRAARENVKGEDWQNSALSRVAAEMLDILSEYEGLIQQVDKGLRTANPHNFSVSLVDLRSRLEDWDSPLTALDALVSTLLVGPMDMPPTSLPKVLTSATSFDAGPPPRCPRWSTGQLLDLLDHRCRSSVGRVHRCMSTILRSVEDIWRCTLIAWMCQGLPQVDVDTSFGRIEDPIVEWRAGESEANILSASILATTSMPKLATQRFVNDDAVPQPTARWQFVPHALPSSIASDPTLSETILYVGRALAKVRNHAKRFDGTHTSERNKGYLDFPRALSQAHAALLSADDARPCTNPKAFKKAIDTIQDDVGEWMWRNILTPEIIFDTFDTLGGYFLHRNGLFATALLSRLSDLRKAKLISARSASANVIQIADVELAVQRASIDAGADDESSLDHCSVFMSKRQSQEQRRDDKVSDSASAPPFRFDDVAVGVPFTLRYHAQFPLDLILTPAELNVYSDIFSYLLSLNAVRKRLRDTWREMSTAQRDRRRFTGSSEGGQDKLEERRRRLLFRKTCGLIREGLWFLDVLTGHFQTDIIDVHYSAFLHHLDVLRPQSKLERGLREASHSSTNVAQQPNVSVDGWRQKIDQPVRRVPSMQMLRESVHGDLTGRDSRSSIVHRPSHVEPLSRKLAHASLKARSVFGGASQVSSHLQADFRTRAIAGQTKQEKGNELTFSTLRQAHQAFLAYVVDGLLLTRVDACRSIWRVLQSCNQLTSMIEGWGGDALPALLSEGSIDNSNTIAQTTETGSATGLERRLALIQEKRDALRRHFESFFVLLSDVSSSTRTGKSSASRSTPEDGQDEDKVNSASMNVEGESAAWRQHEQLLLRLDYNSFFSSQELVEH